MQKILIFIARYVPGYKAGGPIRSIANIVHWLHEEFAFSIVTADRDLGDTQAYPAIVHRQWHSVQGAQVMYLAPKEPLHGRLRQLLVDLDYDAVYLNSFFSPVTVQIATLRRLGLVPAKPCLVAPRGEFAPSALAVKNTKKRVYFEFARHFGLYKGMFWHALNDMEAQAVRQVVTKYVLQPELPETDLISRIFIAPNLTARPNQEAEERRIDKRPGELHAVFLSRISPIKNLDGALRMLQLAEGNITYDIYGPIEDTRYWQACQALITSLPANVHVEYRGPVRHEDIPAVLERYHLLFLPSQSESFGHAIMDALRHGCLVLTSDRTPWRDLAQRRIGWDLPLEDAARFAAAVAQAVAMDEETFQCHSRAARAFAHEYEAEPANITATRRMFLSVCSQT